jgi:L-threonylcarbamoyladenylate synthase
LKVEIEKICKLLHQNGVILAPTDTIWGLSCDATNSEATKKIIDIKKRDQSKSFIVLVRDLEMLQNYTSEDISIHKDVLLNTSRPTTFILPSEHSLAPDVISSDGSVGFRIVDHFFLSELIGYFNKPLVSTSANLSGENSPITFNDIKEEIRSRVDMILDEKYDTSIDKKPSDIYKIDKKELIKIR